MSSSVDLALLSYTTCGRQAEGKLEHKGHMKSGGVCEADVAFI